MLKKILKALSSPKEAYGYLRSKSKGEFYRLWYNTFSGRVSIGKNFMVSGKLNISGPGKVTIGNNVRIGMEVTPWTSSKEAHIIVGNNVFLNGTRFGCAVKIEIGDNSVIADARIMDTDYHSTNPNERHNPDFIGKGPIKIGKNVWVTINIVILKDVTVGDNSTLTPNSVIVKDVPENCVYGGNPAKCIKTLNNEEINSLSRANTNTITINV